MGAQSGTAEFITLSVLNHESNEAKRRPPERVMVSRSAFQYSTTSRMRRNLHRHSTAAMLWHLSVLNHESNEAKLYYLYVVAIVVILSVLNHESNEAKRSSFFE